MTENLGIKLISSDNGRVMAEMPVDYRTCQPFGYLNGGASLALAEIAAGYGSHSLCEENEYPVGMQVSANHISSVEVGNPVFASATLIHRGKTTHVWNVDINTKDNRLVSTIRVVNYILKKDD